MSRYVCGTVATAVTELAAASSPPSAVQAGAKVQSLKTPEVLSPPAASSLVANASTGLPSSPLVITSPFSRQSLLANVWTFCGWLKVMASLEVIT